MSRVAGEVGTGPPAPAEQAMKVEIWSDVVCPWCYLGKRRFEKALDSFAHRDAVQVEFRSFQLDPGAPRLNGEPTAALLARKYGMTAEQAARSQADLTQLAAADGLEYHLDRARRGNTFDAHRLLHLAAASGLGPAVHERFFRGYFTEGVAIGDPAELHRMAVEAGLDEAAVASVLASDRYADAVRADIDLARAIGIHGVPFFVLNRTFGVSGARSPAHLLEALEQAWVA